MSVREITVGRKREEGVFLISNKQFWANSALLAVLLTGL